MEVLHQVRLLLRRNVALRVRQPVILILELLWPVLIFLVIMVARTAIPPVAQPTCYYKAWALPSAGVVPFVQSMICNIDDCQNATQFEDIPTYQGSSVRELVENVSPLIMDQDITELVATLPKGVRLVRVAVDALSGPDLSTLLENGFPVRDLLKESNRTKDLLRELNYTSTEIEQIFNSSVQLNQVLDTFHQNSICEPTESSQSRNAFEKLRSTLCRTSNDTRKEFFRQIRNELNVKRIVQTIGLAMSELGRLDIRDILESVGSLIAQFQSSDILSADFITMLSTFLGEAQLDRLDTQMLSQLIDDLEPLYRHSQWAGIINILKDINLEDEDKYRERREGALTTHFEVAKDNIDQPKIGGNSENADELKTNVTAILDSILEIVDTGAAVLRLLPQHNSTQVQSAFRYFISLAEVVNELAMSLQWDNSTSFIAKAGDLMGAAFFRLADEDSRAADDVEGWRRSMEKLRRVLHQKTSNEIQKNIQSWANENSEKKGGGHVSQKYVLEDVDSFVAAAECAMEKLQEDLPGNLRNKSASSQFATSSTPTSGNSTENAKQPKELVVLSTIARLKSIANEIRHLWLRTEKDKSEMSPSLGIFNKVLEKTLAAHSDASSDSVVEVLKQIPDILVAVQSFSSNASGFQGLPALLSAFIEDLEPHIWSSLSDQMMKNGSLEHLKKHFCVYGADFHENETVWKPLLCNQSSTTFKILRSSKKQIQLQEIPFSDIKPSSTFDQQIFSRMLLRFSSDAGFLLKAFQQLLKSAPGCQSTCKVNSDVNFQKFCFLSRLQNVKKIVNGDAFSDNDDGVLKQLQGFLSIDGSIIEAYDALIEAAQLSAENNYTDYKDIVRLVLSGVRLLEAFDGSEQKVRPALHVTHSLISLLKNRVSNAALYNTTSVVQIQNVFPGSPLTQEVIESLLPSLPEITSTFFWTAMAPGKLFQLISESEKNISVVMSSLCNSSLSKYLYNPGLDRAGFAELGKAVCQHRYYDVFEEIFQDPDIQEIVFEAGNTDEVAWDEMHENILEIISLLTDLAAARKADLSALPPVSKWQKMAKGIHAQAKNPSVILYIISNKAFSGFCNKTLQQLPQHLKKFINSEMEQDLYKDLCSMSKESFAKNVVEKINRTLTAASSPDPQNNAGAWKMAQLLWGTVLGIPQVNNLARTILDLELPDPRQADAHPGQINHIFLDKIMNVTRRAYDLVDATTEGRLSTVILSSYLPEVMQEFATLLKKSGGTLNLKTFLQKGQGADLIFGTLLTNNNEKKQLEAYIQSMGRYFSKKQNAKRLKSLCGSLVRSPGTTTRMLCTQPPGTWSLADIHPRQNFTQIWKEIHSVLDDAARNKTHEYLSSKRKSEFLQAINDTIATGVQIAQPTAVRSSAFYFELFRRLVEHFDEKGDNARPLSMKNVGCVTKAIENVLQDSVKKMLDTVPNAEFATCGLMGRNMSAFYSWFSSSFQMKHVIETVAKDIEEDKSCTYSKKWLLSVIDYFEEFYDKISRKVNDENIKKIKTCLSNIGGSPLITSLKAHTSILKEATRLLLTLNSSTSQWQAVREDVSAKISRHLPAFFRVSDILFNDSLRIHPHFDTASTVLRKTLEDSNINLNWLQRQGFAPGGLKKYFCDSNSKVAARNIFRFPPGTTMAVRSAVRDYLCINGTLEHLMEQIDREGVKDKIQKEQEKEFYSGHWLQKLINSFGVLISATEHLGSALKEVQISSLFDIFQLFTKPQALQSIIESLSKLKSVLDPVFGGSSLADTLEQVMDGVKAFQSLTQLANLNFEYTLKDVFGQNARKFLTNKLQLGPERILLILDSEIDIKQAKVNKELGTVSFCEGEADESIVCALSKYQETKISVEKLQDLMLHKFLALFGSLGIEGILKGADVETSEAGRTLEVLSNAPQVVNRLTRHLHSVTSAMHPDVRELFQHLEHGVDWISTPEALSVGGHILCGKPLTSLSRKFSLLAPEDTENKIEEKELLRLPTDFCRYGYKEIMKMRGGAILWGFLKPLFRGKILYAPKESTAAKLIISKVNQTFQELENHVRFVKAAAEGSTGLHYLQRKTETLLSLQKFLSTKSVSKLLGYSWNPNALTWLETSNTSGGSLLQLVELVGNITECISLNRFIGFDTEADLEAAAATLHDRREFIAALVFMGEEDISMKRRWTGRRASLPKSVLYKIRMDIDNVPSTEYVKYRWWRPYPYDDFFEDHRYFRGFLQLQDTVDNAIMELHHDSSQDQQPIKKYLQQFPYPCHQRDKFGTLLKGSMPAVMTISWVFIVAFLVRERVLDRELELDETLRVMGLKNSATWLSWFITGCAVLSVSVLGITLVLKWGGITPNSNFFILFLFVANFAILLIAYCQLMSAFFGRAAPAALISVLLYVLSFFPFLLFVTWELDFLYWQKLLSCVLVSTAFCFGCLYLNRYEDQGQGVQWWNIWLSPVEGDQISFGVTLVAMALCSVLYFFIAWFVTTFFTDNEDKKPIPLHFFEFPSTKPRKSADYVTEDIKISSDKEQKKPVVGLNATNVTALYSRKGSKEWRALASLNLDFYEDHITALLGHNGAGKTTTLKILTGRITATAGSVAVCGLPIPEKLAEARKLIGFCPQSNTLYDKLTVKEHLYLFAQLKGHLDKDQVTEDVERMISNLNLSEKQDEATEKLSGGQRRRLCVGIAFVGGSKVVILDEPTSSVDPVARRSIWDLILQYKKGRTILLTTHHLDEADILCDRVAILHKGRLLCCGSPLFLKSKYGSGYRLSLLQGSDKSEKEERDSGRASSIIESEEPVIVDSDGVMEFVQSHIPNATLLTNDGSQLVVSLPVEPLSPGSNPFSEFMAHLERSLHCWGFQSAALSSSTLEEVFLALCQVEDAKAAHSDLRAFNLSNSVETPATITTKDELHKQNIKQFAVELSGKEESPSDGEFPGAFKLRYTQLRSLLKKRYWHTRKNWKTLTSSVIMPCVFIALAMALAVGKPQKKPDPSIELTPALYSSNDQKAVSFFAWPNPSPPSLGSVLLGTLKANISSQRICSQGHARCYLEPSNAAHARCLCENECPATPLIQLNSLQTPTQVLYNMSGINIPKYLLDSYLQFNEKRYGGWSLSHNGSETSAVVWFENSGYHTAPSYLNTLNNALLKQSENELAIRTWNHPLRLSVEQLGRETLLQRLGEVGIAFVFLIGLSLVPSTFAVYAVGERSSEQRRLQTVTGALHPLGYWSAALLWDMGVVLANALLSAALIAAFGLPAFYQRENFRAVLAIIILYGWATTPLTYLCTNLFREGSLAFMVIFTSHLFIGLVIMLTLISLRMISVSKDVSATLYLVQRLSLAFPQYCLVGGLTDLNENQIRSEIFAQFGQDVYSSPFSWSTLGPHYTALFVQGCLFFIFTLLIDTARPIQWAKRLFHKKRPMTRAISKDSSNCLLQISNVSKVYNNKAGKKYAVDNLSLSVPEGECFGLVGANGAGKTTLFRLLIGELLPTSGSIISVGLRSNARLKHRFFGYCPQKDALDELLTPRQHLEIYAGLRGITSANVHQVVEASLQSLELTPHADRPVRTLSGGTKRKLCTAIATLGDPSLILLDEPTSGMDPGTRRLVWRTIAMATEAGRSVILTSHSIEDCDVLCSRLGIMVNGRIACLGTPVKLKAALGTGYTISFRIPEGQEDGSSIVQFLQKSMPTLHLQVRSGRRIEIALPDESESLSNLLCHLEKCALKFGIEDLAIDPTTLDQVFVNFVRQQSDSVERTNDELPVKMLLPINGNPEACCTKL